MGNGGKKRTKSAEDANGKDGEIRKKTYLDILGRIFEGQEHITIPTAFWRSLSYLKKKDLALKSGERGKAGEPLSTLLSLSDDDGTSRRRHSTSTAESNLPGEPGKLCDWRTFTKVSTALLATSKSVGRPPKYAL